MPLECLEGTYLPQTPVRLPGLSFVAARLVDPLHTRIDINTSEVSIHAPSHRLDPKTREIAIFIGCQDLFFQSQHPNLSK